jgi:hypothetical protein
MGFTVMKMIKSSSKSYSRGLGVESLPGTVGGKKATLEQKASPYSNIHIYGATALLEAVTKGSYINSTTSHMADCKKKIIIFQMNFPALISLGIPLRYYAEMLSFVRPI